jgi:hypothetical protein
MSLTDTKELKATAYVKAVVCVQIDTIWESNLTVNEIHKQASTAAIQKIESKMGQGSIMGTPDVSITIE